MLSNCKGYILTNPLCIGVLLLVQCHLLLCFSVKTEGSLYDHPKPFFKIAALWFNIFPCVALISAVYNIFVRQAGVFFKGYFVVCCLTADRGCRCIGLAR